jgi:hypothetical protein
MRVVLRVLFCFSCSFYPSTGPSAAVLSFLTESLRFQTSMVAQVGAVDPYWAQIGNLYMQLAGMFEGYSGAVSASQPQQAISWFHLLSLQMDVDIGDISTAVALSSPLATEDERERAQERLRLRQLGLLQSEKADAADEDDEEDTANEYTHCSVLVKTTPGNADLILGHNTWSRYLTMLRTYKLIVLPLSTSTGAHAQHFSSYPGYLFSSVSRHPQRNQTRVVLFLAVVLGSSRHARWLTCSGSFPFLSLSFVV